MKGFCLLPVVFGLACGDVILPVLPDAEQGPGPLDAEVAMDIGEADEVEAEEFFLDELPLETPEPGQTVECSSDSECTGKMPESACVVARCIDGYCFAMPRPEGEACEGVEVPPCRVARCDGKGTCVERHEEDGAPCAPNFEAEPCTVYSCASGACVGHSTCYDGDPCTADTCDGEVCIHQPLNEGACDDKDACTVNDHCFAGLCLGEKVVCDDKDPCTHDECLPQVGCIHEPAENAPCDDGNQCTVNDYCKNGKCKGGAVILCDDHNPCTDDGCSKLTGACIYVPNVAPCDDHDLCTTEDRCQDGVCKGGEALSCEDGNACTDDYCDSSMGCVHAIIPGCQACTADSDCNDNNPCTKDVCAQDDNGEFKCDNVPLTGELCNDNRPCTLGDTCVEGACVGGPSKDCDDGNLCTDDSCEASSGLCIHTPNTRVCDDMNLCTTDDACRQGHCAGSPVTCDDANPCTSDSCDPSSGACKFVPNSDPCDDSNKCTVDDHCMAGGCIGTLVSCDDHDACTVDSCDENTGCVHQTIVGCKSCTNDSQCDDQNPCTEDGCKDKACVFVALDSRPCEDGNACTVNDTCMGGKCLAGKPANCDDSNPCTSDSCYPKYGCVHFPVGGTCEDNDPCTGPDICKDGACIPGPNLCCQGRPDGTACSDQNGATLNDFCLKGVCKGFWAVEFQAVPGADTYLEDIDASGEQTYVAGGFKSGSTVSGFVATVPFGGAPELIPATVVSGRMYRAVSYEAAVGDAGLVAYRLTWGGAQWYVGGKLSSPLFGGVPTPVDLYDVFGLPGTYKSFLVSCKADTYLFVGRTATGGAFAKSCRLRQTGTTSCATAPDKLVVDCGKTEIQGPNPNEVQPVAASGELKACPRGECMMPAAFVGRLQSYVAVFKGDHLNPGDYYDDFEVVGTSPVTAYPLDMVKLSTGESYLVVGEEGLLATTKLAPFEFQMLNILLEPKQSAWVFRSAATGGNVLAVAAMTYNKGTHAWLLLHWAGDPLNAGWTVLPVAACEAGDVQCQPVELTGVAVRDGKIWLIGRKVLKTGSVVGVVFFLQT